MIESCHDSSADSTKPSAKAGDQTPNWFDAEKASSRASGIRVKEGDASQKLFAAFVSVKFRQRIVGWKTSFGQLASHYSTGLLGSERERESRQRRCTARICRTVLVALATSLLVLEEGRDNASAATAVPVAPGLITEPTVNLGNTSFYDGAGRTGEGWVVFAYERYELLNSITNSKGNKITTFRNPHIQAASVVLQPLYVTPWHPFGGGVGFTTLLPIVNLSSHFDQPGASLSANGFGLGDLTFGPFYQAAPARLFNGTVSWRAELDIIAPSGSFNRSKDINQGSGFWSINPYLAMTYLPAPGWEMSTRIHYLYNFATNNFPNPPLVPGLIFNSGQAGQAFHMNFAASKEISQSFSPGVNGYYFQQLTDDAINGMMLSNTKKSKLYLGPGFHWNITKTGSLNANLYFPIVVRGAANGPQINFQYIHAF